MAGPGEIVVVGWCPLGRKPAVSDAEHFEALTASVFQARFRLDVVRARWPAIRQAFADFELDLVAAWPDSEQARLLEAPGMIRNPKKVLATLRNARDLAARRDRFGSLRAYLDAFAPDVDALVDELDGWAHYVGAPSLRWFLGCVGIPARWER